MTRWVEDSAVASTTGCPRSPAASGTWWEDLARKTTYRSPQSPIYPSFPGRTPLFTPKCSQRNVCPSRSLLTLPLISRLFRSWTCGSSTQTRPRGEATTSTQSPRRGLGNPLVGHVDKPPTRAVQFIRRRYIEKPTICRYHFLKLAMERHTGCHLISSLGAIRGITALTGR